MSHYTLHSGQRTVTVSFCCPQCHTRRYVAHDEISTMTRQQFVGPAHLYCSDACRETHTGMLILTASRIMAIFAQQHYHVLASLRSGVIPDELARQFMHACLQER